MQHIVITAFNIFGRNGDDWLVPRMRMFKELALPSAIKQTDKDFTWLILIDSESPKEFVRELVSLVPAGTIIQEVSKASINQSYKGNSGGAISTLAQPVNHMPRIMGRHLTDEWVSTNLVAVDDALSLNFIEELKKVTREKKETIAFTTGAVKMNAGIPHKDGYYKVKTDIFACIAVEPAEEFMSILAGGAHRYRDEKRRIETDEPMWLWHIHGILQNCNPNSNFRMVSNREPYTYEEVQGRFGYEGPAQRYQ
jgi:hypothetical protein